MQKVFAFHLNRPLIPQPTSILQIIKTKGTKRKITLLVSLTNSSEITHSIRLERYFEHEGVVANFNNSK